MNTFSVKDWEEFQHYKDRAPPWIKLYNKLLENYEFGRLQDASKAHLILIWLLASRSNNCLPYDPEWVANKISAKTPVDLEALAKAGFIQPNQPLQSPEQVASTVQAKRLSRERGRDREREDCSTAIQDEFDAFWKVYPRRQSKGDAEKAFTAARKLVDLEPLLAALEKRKPLWVDPKFIPLPATWLRGKGWLDELEPQAAKIDRTPAETYELRKKAFLEARSETWLESWGPRPERPASSEPDLPDFLRRTA